MPARHATFEAIGTHWMIVVQDAVSDAEWLELTEQASARIRTFDQAYSRFRPDSLVTQMAERAGRYELPADGQPLLDFYERLYRATDGRVTPLIGSVMEAAGYDAEYSFERRDLKHPPRWEDTISYDATSLTLQQPALLDFGAAGKGYLVDLVSDILKRRKLSSYVINAGGDILHRSSDGRILEIGLENPYDTTEAIGIARIDNQSMCASAGSKRAWGGLHHIIDPNELTSPQKIVATWVVADDTMTADGLATALFFTEPDVLQKHFTFSYAVLYDDMGLEQAEDFSATLFKAVKT